MALILGFTAIPTLESYEMGQCLNCEQQLNEWWVELVLRTVVSDSFYYLPFHIISRDPIIIFYVSLRCCISSWNGRCCEFPLDHEEEEPQDTVHHSNYFSIQVTTPKPRLNTKSRQFNYKSLFDGFLGRTRVRELPIPKDQKKPYQWWSESKWVQKYFRPSSTLYFNIWLLTRPY